MNQETKSESPLIGLCTLCGVPKDLHGTVCGWDSAARPCDANSTINDIRHPGYGQNINWRSTDPDYCQKCNTELIDGICEACYPPVTVAPQPAGAWHQFYPPSRHYIMVELDNSDELWNEVLEIADRYDGGKESYRTAISEFQKRFQIKRKL